MTAMKVGLKDTSQLNQLTQGTAYSAGYDLRVSESATVHPGKAQLIKTGVFIDLSESGSEQLTAFLFPRSSIYKLGVMVANGVGVIDNDYRGEIRIPVVNVTDKPVTIETGAALAQLVFMECVSVQFTEMHELSESERGEGGFGSTGK